jgi:hypothetical protein
MATARPTMPNWDHQNPNEVHYHTLQTQQASPLRYGRAQTHPPILSHFSPSHTTHARNDHNGHLSSPPQNGANADNSSELTTYPIMYDQHSQLLGMGYGMDPFPNMEYLEPASHNMGMIPIPVSIEPITNPHNMTERLNQQLGPTLTSAHLLSPIDSVFGGHGSSTSSQPGTARYVSNSEYPDRDRGWISRSASHSMPMSLSGIMESSGFEQGQGSGVDAFDWEEKEEQGDVVKQERESPGNGDKDLAKRVVPGLGIKRGRTVGKKFNGPNIDTMATKRT